jgi:hypothetical protein
LVRDPAAGQDLKSGLPVGASDLLDHEVEGGGPVHELQPIVGDGAIRSHSSCVGSDGLRMIFAAIRPRLCVVHTQSSNHNPPSRGIPSLAIFK